MQVPVEYVGFRDVQDRRKVGLSFRNLFFLNLWRFFSRIIHGKWTAAMKVGLFNIFPGEDRKRGRFFGAWEEKKD